MNGKKTSIFTIFSRGSSHKEYGNSLLGKMSTQLKLSKDELNNLITCPLTRDEYEKMLKDKGVV